MRTKQKKAWLKRFNKCKNDKAQAIARAQRAGMYYDRYRDQYKYGYI